MTKTIATIYLFLTSLSVALADTIISVTPAWVPAWGGPMLYGGPYWNGSDAGYDGHCVNVQASISPGNFGVIFVTYTTKWFTSGGSLIKQTSRGLADRSSGFFNGTTSDAALLYDDQPYWEMEPNSWSYCTVDYVIHFQIQDGSRNVLDSTTLSFSTARWQYDGTKYPYKGS